MHREIVRGVIAEANTQYAYTLPVDVRRIVLRRTGANQLPIRLSFVDGEIVAGGGIVIGAEYDTGQTIFTSRTAYIGAEQPGGAWEMEVWMTAASAVSMDVVVPTGQAVASASAIAPTIPNTLVPGVAAATASAGFEIVISGFDEGFDEGFGF